MKALTAFLILVAVLVAPGKAQAIHVTSPAAGIDIDTAKVVHIIGEINPDSVKLTEAELRFAHQLPGDLVVYINSGGGRVDSGIAILQLLSTFHDQGTRIVCVVDRNAHSMAFNILSFCDVRLATAGSRMLVHKIAIELDHMPKDFRGTAKTLKEIAADLEQIDEPFRQANAARMGISLKDYDMYADNQTWFRAPKLLKMGYLDGIAVIGQ